MLVAIMNEEHRYCKADLQRVRKTRELDHLLKDRKGHDMRDAIDPTKIHNELDGYRRQSSRMVSRKPSSGIWKTVMVGKKL
jgi:dTDP-D-glucose 4,6-dehydratase